MKTTIGKLLGTGSAALLFVGAASFAFAQRPTDTSGAGGTSVGTGASVQVTVSSAAMTRMKTRADQEIDRRITALNSLMTRIGQMKRITQTQIQAVDGNLTSQISALDALKAKIDADTDATTLNADIVSVTGSYRIFALVIPQGAILAAGDRELTLASDMVEIGNKLSARISAAQSGGTDVSAAQTAFTDYQAKVTDAGTQAQAAQNEVVSLQPDNGNKTLMQSNTATLKDARSKIQAAQRDFVAARKDMRTIMQNLPKMTGGGSASSTTSTSGQ